MFCELKITNILKLSEWGLLKSELPWDRIFRALGVFPVELLAYQGSMVYAANYQDSSIYILDIKLG